jgi:putative glycosyltransferase (TIGR04372 family)
MRNLNVVRESVARLWNHVSTVSSHTRVSLASRLTFLLLMALLSGPLAVITLLLRPFVEIRFWPIYGDRLGHLVLETDLLVSRLRPENPGVVFLCFFVGKPANSFYAGLLRRKLLIVSPVIGDAGYLVQRTFLRRMFPEHRVDIIGTRGTLSSSNKWVNDGFERNHVQSLLEGLGLEGDSNYVCLWVRDSLYGARLKGGQSQYFADYRDASIRNYHSLCRLLDSRGLTVIRMGRFGIVEGLGDAPYTDYLSSKFNSEENDFLLAKYCSFAICGDSGSLTIPLLFRKPIALTNVGSFVGALSSESVRVLTMKRIEWADTCLPVTASEIMRFGIHRFDDTRQFEELGIRHIENTEMELESVALDMLRLVGEDKGRHSLPASGPQDRFRKLFRDVLLEEPSFMAGTLWLENNPQFISWTSSEK